MFSIPPCRNPSMCGPSSSSLYLQCPSLSCHPIRRKALGLPLKFHGEIVRRSRCRAFGRDVRLRNRSISPAAFATQARMHFTYLCHATIHHKVLPVDERALVCRQEQHRLRLLDRFPKPATREVYLASMTLRLVITQPVLQQRRAAPPSVSKAARTWKPD